MLMRVFTRGCMFRGRI